MPILVQTGVRRRTKKAAKTNWQESYADAYAAWLETYFRDPYPPLPHCPHGVMCEEYPYKGRWSPPEYCTICTPLNQLKGKGKLVRIEGGWLVRMRWSHPLMRGLAFVPRRGVSYLEPRRIIRGHFYPGDHEISNYDERFRGKKANYHGGYFTAGWTADGVGIRSARPTPLPGFVWENNDEQWDAEAKRQPWEAKMLQPWEWERKDAHLFFRRWFNPAVVLALDHHTALIEMAVRPREMTWRDLQDSKKPELVFDEEVLTPRTHPDMLIFPGDTRDNWWFYWEGAIITRGLILPDFIPTEKDLKRYRRIHWKMRGKHSPPTYLPIVRLIPPGLSVGLDFQHGPGYDDSRMMAGLEARLKVYEYASGELDEAGEPTQKNRRYTVARMLKKACGRVHQTWLDKSWLSGPNFKQQPAPFKTHSRLTWDNGPLTKQRYNPAQYYRGVENCIPFEAHTSKPPANMLGVVCRRDYGGDYPERCRAKNNGLPEGPADLRRVKRVGYRDCIPGYNRAVVSIWRGQWTPDVRTAVACRAAAI